MPETERDLRGYRLLLASHSLLAGPRSSLALAKDAVAWAATHGVGLYQLPLPAHALRPRQADGRLTRPRAAELRAEQHELEVVFDQLEDYLASGYRLLGVAVREEDEATAAGRAWLARVVGLALDRTGTPLPVWRLGRGATRFEADVVEEKQ